MMQTFLTSAGEWAPFCQPHSHCIKKKDKPIKLKERERRQRDEGKNEQMNKSERRAVVGGCGVRAPLIKLNFHHRQRHTQIPASQSANLRQMILLSFPATLGVGTAQILIKKEPVNYFPPASKT